MVDGSNQEMRISEVEGRMVVENTVGWEEENRVSLLQSIMRRMINE